MKPSARAVKSGRKKMKEYKSKAISFTLKAERMDFNQVKITSSQDAAQFARQFYFDDIEIFESAFIILLNAAGNTIGFAKIGQGGICGTVVDKMIICKYAVDSLARSVVLVHNHPSGNMRPSRQDDDLTLSVARALEMVGSRLSDHIIISPYNDYYSYSDEGRLY